MNPKTPNYIQGFNAHEVLISRNSQCIWLTQRVFAALERCQGEPSNVRAGRIWYDNQYICWADADITDSYDVIIQRFKWKVVLPDVIPRLRAINGLPLHVIINSAIVERKEEVNTPIKKSRTTVSISFEIDADDTRSEVLAQCLKITREIEPMFEPIYYFSISMSEATDA